MDELRMSITCDLMPTTSISTHREAAEQRQCAVFVGGFGFGSVRLSSMGTSDPMRALGHELIRAADHYDRVNAAVTA